MIALYIVAIVVVCGLVVFYFCWVTRKRKKTLEQLSSPKIEKQKKKKKNEKEEAEQQLERDLKAAEEEVVKEEKKIEAELEDFSLDEFSNASDVGDPHSFNGKTDFDIDESLFESKMEDYEKFLKEEQESHEIDDLSEDDQNDIDALMNFDFDKLKGKTREQVAEMIKDLSPTVQDFILNDIFERKNGED